MPPRDVALLVNPTAGRGRAVRAGYAAASHLRTAGIHVRYLAGLDADEVAGRARDALADGADSLVVVGGDGMVHLGLGLVAGTGQPMGIVAAGTGNDVARSLGLPIGDPAAAAGVVIDGHQRVIDLGQVDDPGRVRPRWFAGVLAAGFDSRVNERANRMWWPRGRRRYDVATLVELGVFRPVPYEIGLDDAEPWHTRAMLVAVGNGPSYGGGLQVTPYADLDDGMLDLTILLPMAKHTFVRLFPTVRHGRHVDHPKVLTRRARRVRLAAPRTTAWADGERVAALPVEVAAVPRALWVFAPRRPT